LLGQRPWAHTDARVARYVRNCDYEAMRAALAGIQVDHNSHIPSFAHKMSLERHRLIFLVLKSPSEFKTPEVVDALAAR
jgi:hypothetical protein